MQATVTTFGGKKLLNLYKRIELLIDKTHYLRYLSRLRTSLQNKFCKISNGKKSIERFPEIIDFLLPVKKKYFYSIHENQ